MPTEGRTPVLAVGWSPGGGGALLLKKMGGRGQDRLENPNCSPHLLQTMIGPTNLAHFGLVFFCIFR